MANELISTVEEEIEETADYEAGYSDGFDDATLGNPLRDLPKVAATGKSIEYLYGFLAGQLNGIEQHQTALMYEARYQQEVGSKYLAARTDANDDEVEAVGLPGTLDLRLGVHPVLIRLRQPDINELMAE